MADTAKRQSQSKVGCQTLELPITIRLLAIDILQNIMNFYSQYWGKKFIFLGV